MRKYSPQDLQIAPTEVVTLNFGFHPVTKDPITRTLYLGCNEISELEDLLQGALATKMQDPNTGLKIGTLIKILWVGLKVFEPDLTQREVGTILSRQFGDVPRLWEAVTEALRKGVPGLFGALDTKSEEAPQPAPLAQASAVAPAPPTSAA